MIVTVQQINDALELIVTNHIQLKKFYTISVDKMDIEQFNVNQYPFMYGQVVNTEIDESGTTFTYEIIIADLVIEANQDINNVLAQTQLIIQDVLSEFIFSGASQQFINRAWVIDLPINCTPIQYEFANSVTGWKFNLDITVPNATTLCDALYSIAP